MSKHPSQEETHEWPRCKQCGWLYERARGCACTRVVLADARIHIEQPAIFQLASLRADLARERTLREEAEAGFNGMCHEHNEAVAILHLVYELREYALRGRIARQRKELKRLNREVRDIRAAAEVVYREAHTNNGVRLIRKGRFDPRQVTNRFAAAAAPIPEHALTPTDGGSRQADIVIEGGASRGGKVAALMAEGRATLPDFPTADDVVNHLSIEIDAAHKALRETARREFAHAQALTDLAAALACSPDQVVEAARMLVEAHAKVKRERAEVGRIADEAFTEKRVAERQRDEAIDRAERAERSRDLALRDNEQSLGRAERAEAERDAYKRDFDAELAGSREMRKRFGARENETMWMFHERVDAERDALKARVGRARAALGDFDVGTAFEWSSLAETAVRNARRILEEA